MGSKTLSPAPKADAIDSANQSPPRVERNSAGPKSKLEPAETKENTGIAMEPESESTDISLLRFVTIGSVDDGKSTLIGRLLYESGAIYDDQLAAITSTNTAGDTEIAFANLTDGLVAEREQGITIDVAYRYFDTPKRKFIIADTPGHLQYTRNMVTGASTADAAIILIDARNGVLQQSRRHAYIASLLGIKHLIVAINKMDLVNYDPAVFQAIADRFRQLAPGLTGEAHNGSATKGPESPDAVRSAEKNSQGLYFIPISALRGDNIIKSSPHTPWYTGPTVFELLQTLPIPQNQASTAPVEASQAPSSRATTDHAFAMPVQLVLRPDQDFRGYAGNIAAGSIAVGDPIVAWPSGRKTRVKSINLGATSLMRAAAPMAVNLELHDEIDVSRGDVLCSPQRNLIQSHALVATMVWMGEQPLVVGRSYRFKHANRICVGVVHEILSRQNMDDLAPEAAPALELNDIGQVTIHLQRSWTCDRYRNDRNLGSFVVIDRLSHATVAAGLIEGPAASAPIVDEDNLTNVDADERASNVGQRPALIRLHGKDSSNIDTLAIAVERCLLDRGHFAYLIPRSGPPKDAQANLERLKILLDAGLLLIERQPPRDADQPIGFSRIDITLEDHAAASVATSSEDFCLSAKNELEIQVEQVLRELIAQDLIDSRHG